jgi:hypothetical protein
MALGRRVFFSGVAPTSWGLGAHEIGAVLFVKKNKSEIFAASAPVLLLWAKQLLQHTNASGARDRFIDRLIPKIYARPDGGTPAAKFPFMRIPCRYEPFFNSVDSLRKSPFTLAKDGSIPPALTLRLSQAQATA